MKTKVTNLLTLLAGSSLFLVACNPLNKMTKKAEMVKYEVSPNPIELVGDSVELTFSGKIPPEYFHKKVIVEVTPVLKYPAGSAEAQSKTLKTYTLKGEALEGDGQIIKMKEGGSFSYKDKIAYEKDMRTAEVSMEAHGKFKKKEKVIKDVKVGDGTIVTQLLVKGNEKPILGKDNFVRVTPTTFSADIHYLINRDRVRASELRMDDVTAISSVLDSLEEKRITLKNCVISAYASPDGEISLNENLADDRAKSASKAVMNIFKRKEIEQGTTEDFYKLEGKGEDWEGFKTAMEASNIEDKNLIIRILEMYSDVNKREQEIKNLAKTYLEVADEILPQLRRSQIIINAEINGFTDEELKEYAQNDPSKLNEEEILFAATLFDDLNQKLAIYQTAEKQFPEDWRMANNVGYVYFLQNKLNDAKMQFEKAEKIASNEGAIKNNLGAVARLMGDKKKAEEYYTAASGAGPELSYNQGILNVMNGDYSAAVSFLSGTNSFNEALAKLLAGDSDAALRITDNDECDEKGTALGFYLRAVAGARKESADIVTNNLKSSIAKDPAMREQAKTDAEFIKYRDDANFGGIVN